MADITSIRGAPIPEGKCPNVGVLRLLDDLREQALRGEVTAMAVAYLDGSGRACNGWSDVADDLPLVGAVTVLQYRLAIANGSEE